MIAMMFQKFDSKGCWVKILEKAKISLCRSQLVDVRFQMSDLAIITRCQYIYIFGKSSLRES